MCGETYNIRLSKTSNKRDSRVIIVMLNPIPSWAVKLQHPIEVSVEWHVMGLAIRSLEAEDEEIVRQPNVPGVEYLGDECFMDF